MHCTYCISMQQLQFICEFIYILIDNFLLIFASSFEKAHPLYYFVQEPELAVAIVSFDLFCFNYLKKFVRNNFLGAQQPRPELGTLSGDLKSVAKVYNIVADLSDCIKKRMLHTVYSRSIIIRAVIEFRVTIIYFINDKNDI